MEAHLRPRNLRTILLAFPKKGRVTKKYRPPIYIPGSVDSGVRPGTNKGPHVENWRLGMLAKTSLRKTTQRYVFIPEEGCGSGVSPATLAGQGTSRSYELSRPVHRILLDNRKLFKFLGEPFLKNMTNTITQSWNSIYNFYKKGLADLRLKRRMRRPSKKDKGKSKGKPKSAKELRELKWKRFNAWCATRALPKRIFKPKPGRKRKIADLAKIGRRMNQLAEPKMVTKKYIRPSIDSQYKDPTRVSDAARKCVPSDRTKELARSPAHKLKKEPIFKPGAVKRSALTCKVSPRFEELAVPKKKAAEKDSDLKENPFMISPTALKYKPTARVQELAKPIER